MVPGRFWIVFAGFALLWVAGCARDGAPAYPTGQAPLILSGPPETPFTIKSRDGVVGGPLAQGRVGDQLLANDQVRVVIQQPGKYPGLGSVGGHLIDADLVRHDKRGHDQFGVMLPILNVEWTLNGINMFAVKAFDPEQFDPATLPAQKIIERPAANDPQVLIVQGVIDTYDYLDIDFLEPLAQALTGQSLFFAPRFDDMNDPFRVYDLKGLQIDVTTAYQLDASARAVKITTTLFNTGDAPVAIPVGDFVNGSGELQLLIPGLGFTPPLEEQIQGATPALIYAGLPGSDLSYGYFFDPAEFPKSTSLSYAGVTGVLLGEEFLKIFPIGGGKSPTINFTVPAGGRRSLRRYFVVGDGSAGSVMDEGLRLLKIRANAVGGRVVDAAGTPISQATVALLNEQGRTVVTYRTDVSGRFQGLVSSGADERAAAFGNGKYAVRVEKPGYHQPETDRAGSCAPEQIDLQSGSVLDITCTLGLSGIVAFAGPVTDAETGAPFPARVTIVGSDPSPDAKAPGIFYDQNVWHRPAGIVDLLYLTARGGIGLTDGRTIPLEPGTYFFVFTHGPEYGREVRRVVVAGGAITEIRPVALKRVAPTPGFVGADFHIHALPSPDSAMAPEQRALAAAAEGIDVLHSSDHDYLLDYGPVVRALEMAGTIIPGAMATVVGDEISPNALGHIHAFPLTPDPSRPNNGALDWSLSSRDQVGPDPDYLLSVQEIIDRIKAAGGEKVIQVNHINDRATSLFLLAGLVTTTAYRESHGVEALATYADPIAHRLPSPGGLVPPLPLGQSGFFSTGFTAVELVVGPELAENGLRESSLPQWFNLLNLGLCLTATADSDSHTPISVPLGLPRNYIASPVDPKDEAATDFAGFDADRYAAAINEGKVVVSAGPYIQMQVTGDQDAVAGIGEVVRSQRPRVRVEVTAPGWAWFDTIELYANAIPTPVDDDGIGVGRGAAADPSHFHAPYHRPRFIYDPRQVFRLADGTLKEWKEEGGVIRAVVETTMELDHDTWLVAFVRGTPDTPGFRSLFPYVTLTHAGADAEVAIGERTTLDDLAADGAFAIPAWAFTNPVFIDIDGDTNNDGRPFEAIYVKQGISPVGAGARLPAAK